MEKIIKSEQVYPFGRELRWVKQRLFDMKSNFKRDIYLAICVHIYALCHRAHFPMNFIVNYIKA